MADTEQIRSSPAKSVDSEVAPKFYASVAAELEPHYTDIDEFCARLQDRLTPTTGETLKTDVLHHTIDCHAQEIISNTPVVEALSILSQLCRECEEYVAPKPYFVDSIHLKYKVYSSVVHCVPKIIRDCLIKRDVHGDSSIENATDNDGADGVLIEGKYIITPYKICTQYGSLLRRNPKTHKTISEVISNSHYSEDVKRYLLRELDVWLSEGTLWDSEQ